MIDCPAPIRPKPPSLTPCLETCDAVATVSGRFSHHLSNKQLHGLSCLPTGSLDITLRRIGH